MGEDVCLYIKREDLINKLSDTNWIKIVNDMALWRYNYFLEKCGFSDFERPDAPIKIKDIIRNFAQTETKISKEFKEFIFRLEDIDLAFCGDYDDEICEQLEKEGYVELDNILWELIEDYKK